jgi:hypothetical protein
MPSAVKLRRAARPVHKKRNVDRGTVSLKRVSRRPAADMLDMIVMYAYDRLEFLNSALPSCEFFNFRLLQHQDPEYMMVLFCAYFTTCSSLRIICTGRKRSLDNSWFLGS